MGLSDAEHRELPELHNDRDSCTQSREKQRERRTAQGSLGQLQPDAVRHTRPFLQRLPAHLRASPASPLFTHIIILPASGILLSRCLEGPTRQANRLDFPSGGGGGGEARGFLIEYRCLSPRYDRPRLLLPSSPFLAVLDGAFG